MQEFYDVLTPALVIAIAVGLIVGTFIAALRRRWAIREQQRISRLRHDRCGQGWQPQHSLDANSTHVTPIGANPEETWVIAHNLGSRDVYVHDTPGAMQYPVGERIHLPAPPGSTRIHLPAPPGLTGASAALHRQQEVDMEHLRERTERTQRQDGRDQAEEEV